MSILRKTYPQAVLKNLPIEKQDAIVDHTDGRNGMKPHSLPKTVAWLKSIGIKTNSHSLSDFRRWYLLREQMQADEDFSMQVVQTCRERGWIKTAEEERAAGQAFFNRLTLGRKDPKQWTQVQQINLSKEKMELEKEKLKLQTRKYRDKAEKGGEAVKKRKLSPDEKQRRIRQILGTE